ncbi:MAG: class I SAM-dependent methyltransferase [Bdellovibrionaceae bacterium]|nr:class I SAM-dependent methyltransferase [Pseudobdellovibrionaceae bacterium]
MSDDSGSIQHVSDTALWVAHYRAVETERPDALFQDPYARALVGDKGRQIAERMKAVGSQVSWSLSIRTHVIDRYIQDLIAGDVDLVLNLGAGLDTRPYRMALPESLLWIEVDYPHMIQHKEKILGAEKPRCRLERVPLDLADRPKRQALLREIAARSKKILVLTEGVIPYLHEQQVAELAEDLRAHPGFRFWIAEYFAKESYRHLQSPARMKQMRNAPFVFFPEDWFGFFKTHGWVPRDIKYLDEESLRLGRPVPLPWWAKLFVPFMSAARRLNFRRFRAYVLFERDFPR